MTNGGSGKSDAKGSAFIRWQGIARDQLGTTVNLALTLATATLGFGVNLLFKKDMVPLARSVHDVVTVALGVITLSIALGIAVNISRLSDFRWTARSARLSALKRAYTARRSPRLSPWVATLDGYDDLAQSLTTLQQLAEEADNLPKETIQMGGLAVPLMSPKYGELTTTMENIRRELPAEFDVLRDSCRTKSDNRSDTTWLLFVLQLTIFAGGIVLLSEALAFQSYQH